MKRLALIGMVLLLTSCASKEVEKEIETKAQVSEVHSAEQLGKTIQTAIKTSKHLSEDQKLKLEEILKNNKATADRLTEESFRFRGVLIQELLSENVDQKKVRVIRRNIQKVEREKLRNTLDTIKLISKAVSRNPDRKEFSEPLMNFDRNSK